MHDLSTAKLLLDVKLYAGHKPVVARVGYPIRVFAVVGLQFTHLLASGSKLLSVHLVFIVSGLTEPLHLFTVATTVP